jgi:hypothetical protein
MIIISPDFNLPNEYDDDIIDIDDIISLIQILIILKG